MKKKIVKYIIPAAAVVAVAVLVYWAIRNRKYWLKAEYRSDKTQYPAVVDLYNFTEDIMFTEQNISDGTLRWVRLDNTSRTFTEGAVTYVKIKSMGKYNTTTEKIDTIKISCWIERDVLQKFIF